MNAVFSKLTVLAGACSAIYLGSCMNAAVSVSKLKAAISPASAQLLHAVDAWPFVVTVTNTGSADTVVAITYTITGPGTSAVQTVSGLAVPANSSVTDSLNSAKLNALNIFPGTNTVTAKVSDGSTTVTCADHPQLKVYYDLVVIDTYSGAASPTLAPGNNYLDLFGPAGDATSSFNLWNSGTHLAQADLVALAHDDGSAPDRPTTTPQYSNYAYVQYLGGIEPGVSYYIRARMLLDSDFMGYAIRLLTVPGSTYSSADLSVSIPGSATTDDPASPPLTGGKGVPTSPVNVTTLSFNTPVGRNLAAGGVHWFKFSLP